MNAWAAIAFVVSILSFIMMILLYVRTTKLQQSIDTRTKNNLNFMVNLIINAAADPETLRRLLKDYYKVDEWRGKLFRREEGKYSIGFEVPTKSTLRIGDMDISMMS